MKTKLHYFICRIEGSTDFAYGVTDHLGWCYEAITIDEATAYEYYKELIEAGVPEECITFEK